MSDLISRQAAIYECYPVTVDGEVYEVVQVETLMGLPSAQTEIIRCKDCRHNGSFDTDCPIDWKGKEYCSFAERREDATKGHEG